MGNSKEFIVSHCQLCNSFFLADVLLKVLFCGILLSTINPMDKIIIEKKKEQTALSLWICCT